MRLEPIDVTAARAGRRLRPPPRIPLSQWIETHLRLPEGLAAKPGPVRLWPFQRGIADAITDPHIERVTVRKSARVGFSTLLTGTLASYIANEPAPLLYLLPTEDDCFDAETEVLTENGWRLFKDLASDRLATVNLETDLIEYQIPSRLIARPYSGEMVSISTRRLDVLVTPTHRMVTYARTSVDGHRQVEETPRITLAGDLTTEHRIKVTAGWRGNGKSVVTVPASFRDSDGMAIEPARDVDACDLAELVGWYVSEGHRRRLQNSARQRRVEITQNSGPKHDRIAALLERLPWHWWEASAGRESSRRFMIASKQLFELLDECGDGAAFKRVPQWIKDAPPQVIARFLDAMVLGDGWVIGESRRLIATVCEGLANDLQELFFKIGNSAAINRRKAKPYCIRGRGGDNTVDQFYVAELRKQTASLRSRSMTRVPYDGMVYCATVPNGTLVCRRGGKIFVAGNCRDYVVSDMEPVFDATPAVKGLLSSEMDETGRNTIRHRRFPGGSLKIVAAKSPRNLRRHTVRILLIDEEDGMEVTPEGDPVDLAIKRTLTFPNRKIVRGSTPVDLETSTICREYEASDKRIYEMHCVECGEFAEPEWSHIQWEKDKPQTARWACPHCGTLIDERYKVQMVAEGRWRATRPEVEGHAGFKLNALISPHYNASWAKLAAEWLEVCDDPDRLRTFKNTLLGDPWSEAVDAIEPESLLARVEMFGLNVTTEDGARLLLPREVLVCTAGVDVQDDRLEMIVYGWSREGAMFALGHFVIWGSPGEHATWAELDAALTTKWDHPLGGKIGIDACCVDAGDGGWVDQVYEFCWPRARRKIVAIKGVAGNRPVIEGSKGKVAKGTVSGKGRLWIVGVDTVKTALLMRLSRNPETIRFSKSLPLAWFEQLLSERRVIKRIAGRPVRRFERIPGLAAEALDATVYAIAARQLVQSVNLDQREIDLIGTPAAPVEKKKEAPPKESFIGGRRKGWLG